MDDGSVNCGFIGKLLISLEWEYISKYIRVGWPIPQISQA